MVQVVDYILLIYEDGYLHAKEGIYDILESTDT